MDVVSEMSMATTVARSVIVSRLVSPRALEMAVPMVSARLVSERSEPSTMPAPKTGWYPSLSRRPRSS